MTDRLREMFELQLELQTTTFGKNFQRMRLAERVQYIKDMVLAATDELHEALNETGWKPWATKRHINEDAYIAELVDAWHFLMNLMLATGREPDELADLLFDGYIRKRERNVARQAEGYDGVSSKCGHCGRALDDAAVGCWRKGDQGYCAEVDADLNFIQTQEVMVTGLTVALRAPRDTVS